MQKIRFYRPEPVPRSCPPQELKTILVPGKRKPFIKQVLEPVPPKIDNRIWYSVAQVVKALAENRLHPSFANHALAESRAYEQHYRVKVEARRYTYDYVPTGSPERTQTHVQTFSVCDPLNGEHSGGFSRKKAKPTPDAASRAKYLRAKLRRR